MPRPGFVLETDDKMPPILTIGGDRIRAQRFGLGTKIIYPAEGEPSSDPAQLIGAALDAPLSGEPLVQRLNGCRSLTIVFGDNASPRPQPRFDVRRDIIERLLELAARNGIDDVALVCATGLNRQMTSGEFVQLVGERVVSSFLPDGLLRNHDVTDGAAFVTIGTVEGHELRINRRVAESDLVVHVALRAADRTGSLRQLVCGVTDLDTIDFVAGLDGLAHPERAERVASAISDAVPIITIEAVLGTPVYDPPLGFINRREWEWRISEQLAYIGIRQLLARAPKHAASRLLGGLRADYAVLDVIVGDPGEADRQGRQVWRTGNAAHLPEPADVAVTSVWGIGHGASDVTGSPLAASHHALVCTGVTAADAPLVREGGVLVAFHPLANRFSNRHQSAAADFFAEVLPETLDPRQVRSDFQDRYVNDAWYLQLYRTQHAFHPLAVFHQWYASAAAESQLGDVIWVGADRRSAAVLGHRAASSYADALEIASNRVGRQPGIVVLR